MRCFKWVRNISAKPFSLELMMRCNRSFFLLKKTDVATLQYTQVGVNIFPLWDNEMITMFHSSETKNLVEFDMLKKLYAVYFLIPDSSFFW